MKNFSSYRANKQMLTPTPTPTTLSINCDGLPFLFKIKRWAKNEKNEYNRNQWLKVLVLAQQTRHNLIMAQLNIGQTLGRYVVFAGKVVCY